MERKGWEGDRMVLVSVGRDIWVGVWLSCRDSPGLFIRGELCNWVW